MKKFTIIMIILLFILLFVPLIKAADCDYTPLEKKIILLNSSYIKLNESYDKLKTDFDELNESCSDYNDIDSERIYYKNKYLNSSVSNITIGDFVFYMDSIENNYNNINQSITKNINNIKNWNIKLTIAFSLLSVTFLVFEIFKLIKKKDEKKS